MRSTVFATPKVVLPCLWLYVDELLPVLVVPANEGTFESTPAGAPAPAPGGAEEPSREPAAAER